MSSSCHRFLILPLTYHDQPQLCYVQKDMQSMELYAESEGSPVHHHTLFKLDLTAAWQLLALFCKCEHGVSS